MNLKRLLFLIGLLPAGLFAAPPDLMVLGNQIVTVNGHCPVRLHGLNVCALEYSNTGAGPTGSPNPQLTSVQEAVSHWGSNFIRLPLNQDRWLGTACGSNGTDYQAIVTDIVNWCNANNIYVLLDLHWNDLGQAGGNNVCTAGQHDMPDDNSTLFWQNVAAVYANNPAVFFDLYNEPGGASGTTSLTSDAAGWNMWRNGGTVPASADGVAYHTPGLQGLLNAIRAAGANNMVWAGGINWAFDLSGLPTYNAWLSDTGSGHGVVYATHIYPYKLAGNGCVTAACFNSGVPAAVKSACPVMVTEFAPNPNDPEGFLSPLMAWINANNLSYCPWALAVFGTPWMISDYYTPTSWFGVPVQNALLAIPPNACMGTPTPTPIATATPYAPAICAVPSPVIDGILNDPAWTGPTNAFSTLVVGASAGGASGAFQTRYDQNYFYVAVAVTDPTLYYNAANYSFDNSAVEVFFNTNYPVNNTPLTTGDFQYIVDWSGNSQTCACLFSGHGSTAGVLWGTTTTATGYNVEMAVPWSTLGKPPSAGLALGFDVEIDVNHSNPGTNGRTAQLAWSGNGYAWTDTSQFGSLILGPVCVMTSPTISATLTDSATASPTITRSPSSTFSPTVTLTPTISPTPTASPSLTPSGSPTQTATASPTFTMSPSSTSSSTATLTPTISPTPTVSPSLTPSGSPTPTATASLTFTRSPSPTSSSTVTLTPTISPTFSVSPVFSPSPGNKGNSVVVNVLPIPNPQAGPVHVFDVQLTAPADEIEGRIYTKAMILVAEEKFQGIFTGGWNNLSWSLPGLDAGVYFVRFSTGSGGRGKIATLVVLR